MKVTLTKRNSSNQLFSNFVSKAITFTEFLPNKDLTVTVWKLREFSLMHFWQKIRESNGFTISVTEELI